MIKGRERDYGLEFLLAFNGRIHHLEEGYWIKFEIKRVKATGKRPHGLAYSFTLHAPEGARLSRLRQRSCRFGQGLPVQGATGGDRPLAQDRERSGEAVRIQGCRDPDRQLLR